MRIVIETRHGVFELSTTRSETKHPHPRGDIFTDISRSDSYFYSQPGGMDGRRPLGFYLDERDS